MFTFLEGGTFADDTPVTCCRRIYGSNYASYSERRQGLSP